MNFLYILNSDNEVYKKRETLSVTASSTASSHEASWAAELPVSKYWKPTESNNAYVEIDFGEDISADFCAVVNHRVTASATFRVQGGASAAPSDFVADLPVASRFSSYKVFDSTQTYRYWRIRLDDIAAGSEARLGYVVLGLKSNWTFQYPNGWTREQETIVRRANTELGVPIIGLPVLDRRRFRLSLEALTTTQRDEVQTFFQAQYGGQVPLFMVPDPNYDEEGIFGRLDQDALSYNIRNKGFRDLRSVSWVEDNLGFDLRFSV